MCCFVLLHRYWRIVIHVSRRYQPAAPSQTVATGIKFSSDAARFTNLKVQVFARFTNLKVQVWRRTFFGDSVWNPKRTKYRAQTVLPWHRGVGNWQWHQDQVDRISQSTFLTETIRKWQLERVAVPPPPPLSSLDTLNLWLNRGVLYQSTIGGRSFVYRDIDRDKSTVTEVTRRIRRYRERLPRKKLHVECEDYTQPLYDRTSLPPGMTLLNTWHYPVYYSALRLMTVHPHILHGASFVALFLCDVLSSFPPYSHLLHVRGVNGGYGLKSWVIRQDRKISRRAMSQFLGNSGVWWWLLLLSLLEKWCSNCV